MVLVFYTELVKLKSSPQEAIKLVTRTTSAVFIVNFEPYSTHFFGVYIVGFEQIDAGWNETMICFSF